ncbi:MAG: hypothetical protein J5720_04090 [Bacteroidaceae bacterium]|nr:hypothetical protein [Bacteroidaceae bacterium]
MTQEVIVYIIIGVAALAVAIRVYRIFTRKHHCCEKSDDGCCCEGCELAKECNMGKCKNK